MGFEKYSPAAETVDPIDVNVTNTPSVTWDGNLFTADWKIAVAAGQVPGWRSVNKFGAALVPTTFTPICEGGFYRTPQVGSATSLRVKAGNANDTAAGTGAQKIKINGLDANGTEVTEELTTAGTSASTASSTQFIRLHRLWVSESGTYGTATSGSHAGDIVIENAAGTEDWATITVADFPRGQSQIGVYSIPAGEMGYVDKFHYSIDSTKTLDLLFFQRRSILDTAAPYQAMRLITELKAIQNSGEIHFDVPVGGFPGPCDLGFLAKSSVGTSDITIDFDIFLKEDA